MDIPKLGEFRYPYPGNSYIKSNLKEKKGLIIEIEGLDGSGKSSQLKMIERKLKEKYSKVYVGNFIHSDFIKDILLRTKYENCDEYTFTFMYLMGLTNFFNCEIAEKLNDGYIVVLDRYIDTIKSKALIKNIDNKWLNNILSIYRKPDINIFIDTLPNICLERKKKDNEKLSFWECGCEVEDDSLRFEYNYIMRNIEFRHIIYIEKEQDSKRCIIKTTYGDQYINKSLNDMYELLDSRFIKTSRSCIANSDFIKEFIIAENKLVFKNGEYTYLISRNMKKGLRKYARVNN